MFAFISMGDSKREREAIFWSGLGRVVFSSAINYSYLSGSTDGGFPGPTVIADLNNDGWNDVIQSPY